MAANTSAPPPPAADLSALILKGSMMSERDAGFCSGGDEDDLDVDDVHSPTDASEDSVEVKVTPISPRNKNKRKCAEPRKVANDFACGGPLKKRLRHELSETGQNPFRPWSLPAKAAGPASPPYHPVYGYEPAPATQDEPLALVKPERRSSPPLPPVTASCPPSCPTSCTSASVGAGIIRTKEFARMPAHVDEEEEAAAATAAVTPRVPPHPGVLLRPAASALDHISARFSVDALLAASTSAPVPAPSTSTSTSSTSVAFEPQRKASSACDAASQAHKEQRNYKNMTRERRIEANARERTRVHTISAAFDTLRKAIPAYSHNQKLSKLSVLRIACSYILTLSRVAGDDYSADQSEPPLSECVDLVGRTIQTEGKLRKKKDE